MADPLIPESLPAGDDRGHTRPVPRGETARTRAGRAPSWAPSLSGLRFPAFLAVFACHAAEFWAMDGRHDLDPVARIVLRLGPVAVSCFFILSGFVLARTARDGESARVFWRRRLARIYPSHLVVWALLMTLIHVVGVPRFGPVSSLAGDVSNALLVSVLLPFRVLASGGNVVTWSLTCELVFYALFPALLPLVRRIRVERLVPVALGLAGCTWAIAFGAAFLHDNPMGRYYPGMGFTEFQMALVHLFPLSRLPEFLFGMVLARVPQGRRMVWPVPFAALLTPAALALGTAVLPPPFLIAAVTMVPLGLLVRSAAAADARGRSSVLGSAAVDHLGKLSYALYLLHIPVLMAVVQCAGEPSPAALGISFALTLALAYPLHFGVERPCVRRFARRRGMR